MLLVFVVGDILGGGIYALTGEVGREVGGAIWSAFLLALLLALLTAGSYAELTTKYPRAGGAALYAQRAFGSHFIAFMVAFAVMASGLTSASALARALGGDYLGEFVDLPVVPVALVFLVCVALLNFRGIAEAVKVNLGLTLVEIAGLGLIVLVGVAAVISGTGEPDRVLEFKEGTAAPLAVFAGAALAFYALIGFEDSANVAEEAADPRRSFPIALFGGIAIAGVVYVLVTLTASTVVPTDQLAGSSGPLLEVVQEGPLSVPTKLFSAIGILAIANGALINMIMASRLLYGMAADGVVPRSLGRVHRGRRTPWVSITVTTGAALILAATGDLEPLADTTVLLLVNVFIVVNVAVLILKRDPVGHDHFEVPVAIPVLGIAACALVMTQAEPDAWLRAGVIVVIGLGLWFFDMLSLASDRGAAERG